MLIKHPLLVFFNNTNVGSSYSGFFSATDGDLNIFVQYNCFTILSPFAILSVYLFFLYANVLFAQKHICLISVGTRFLWNVFEGCVFTRLFFSLSIP